MIKLKRSFASMNITPPSFPSGEQNSSDDENETPVNTTTTSSANLPANSAPLVAQQEVLEPIGAVLFQRSLSPVKRPRLQFESPCASVPATPPPSPRDGVRVYRRDVESAFAAVKVPPPEDVSVYAPTAKKPRSREMCMTPHGTSNTGRTYTIDEVVHIVKVALADQEDKLRTEYDKILQQKLQEQFMSFSKFNEDYVSHRMRERDLSYVS
ncbi:hypothetical protein Pelo_357 [Pelomyxa schiedti]|nr:hypothetical protein Pelo_357 [Pelomyxa schiedti]